MRRIIPSSLLTFAILICSLNVAFAMSCTISPKTTSGTHLKAETLIYSRVESFKPSEKSLKREKPVARPYDQEHTGSVVKSFERTRADARFANPQAFYDFMKTGPGWTPELVREVFPEDFLARCMDRQGVIVEDIRYKSDGGWVNGILVAPEKREASPLIIYNRGGFAKYGRLLQFNRFEFCRLAERGFTVMASDFRGNEGPGEDQTDLGYGDVLDSLALISLASKIGGVDTSRIGVWGFSRGTSITAMMLTRHRGIRAVVMAGTAGDATTRHRREEFNEHVYPLLIPNWNNLPTEEQNRKLQGISPIHLVDQIQGKPAFLILHGNRDWRTSPRDALRYATALVKRRHRVDLRLVDGTDHVMVNVYPWVMDSIIAWFEKHLG